jgi:hypothetical protein
MNHLADAVTQLSSFRRSVLPVGLVMGFALVLTGCDAAATPTGDAGA